MTDLDLDTLTVRLAALPAGPWRWAHAYQTGRTHWCLENDASAVDGSTIDLYSITHTSQVTATDDAGNQVRVCDTPVMAFLADSRALVDDLLAEVRQWREIFARDCLTDSPALQAAHRMGQEAMRERVAEVMWRNGATRDGEHLWSLVLDVEVTGP